MERKAKIMDFFKKNKLYLILAVSVLAAGAMMYFAFMGAEGPGAVVDKNDSEGLGEATNKPSGSPSVSPTTPDKGTEVSASPTDSETPSESESGSNTPSKTKTYLKMPLEGEIIKEFSGETLKYNSTLRMWSTHNGIDIAGKTGDPVSAAMAGTVTKVKEDVTMGKMIEITHSDGTLTRYAGLESVIVAEGDKVNAGTKIGTLGTPPFEAQSGPHLHFEYVVKGKYSDPVARMEKD